MKKILSMVLIFLIVISAFLTLAVRAEAENLGASKYSVDVSLCNTQDDPELVNQYLRVTVDNQGHFQAWTADGKPIFYPRFPTSQLAIRIGPAVYGNNYPTAHGGMTNLNQYITRTIQVGNTIISNWELPEGIILTQEIELREKLIRFTILVKNIGSTLQTVDLRYLWDIQIADNDGAPYILPDGSTIDKETEYAPPPFDWWAAMDRPHPETTLTIFGSWINKPDKLQFVYWEHVFSSFEFDYTVDPDFAFYRPPHTTYPESDSAVVMYWTGITLSPGQETSVTSYYGGIKTPFPQKLERGTKANLLSKKVLTLVPLNEQEEYSSASVWSRIVAATAAVTWFDDRNVANYRPLLYVNMSDPTTKLDSEASRNYYLYPIWNFSQTFYNPDEIYIIGNTDIPGVTGTKIAGQYEVATTFWVSSPGAIVVTDYASGLSACPLAAYIRWPIFYLDPSQEIPKDFDNTIRSLKPTDANVFYAIIVSSNYDDACSIETKLHMLSLNFSIATRIILIDNVNMELVYQIKLYETYPQMNYIVITNSADLDEGQLRGISLAAGQLAAFRKAAILDVSRIKLPNGQYFSPSMISYGVKYSDNLALNGVLDEGESVDYVKAIWDAERELVDALAFQGLFAVTDHERATGNSQRFVAIVGSSTAVPFKVCYVEPITHRCIDSRWAESDYILSDNIYGQFDESQGDTYGIDAAVGRILTLDPADASMQVARALAYKDLLDPKWQNNVLISGIYFTAGLDLFCNRHHVPEQLNYRWMIRTSMEAAEILDEASDHKLNFFYLFDVNKTVFTQALVAENPLEYLGGKFKGANQEGRQITVPLGTEVEVWVHVNNTLVSPFGEPVELSGELKVEVKKDIIMAPDEVYKVFTKNIHLGPHQDSWFKVGSFVANDETGTLPFQVREYFIKVYFNNFRIYDHKDPAMREWVRTGTANTWDSSTTAQPPFDRDDMYFVRNYNASTVYNERDLSVKDYPNVHANNFARATTVNLAKQSYNKLLVLVYAGHGWQEGWSMLTTDEFEKTLTRLNGSTIYKSAAFSLAPTLIYAEACLTTRLAKTGPGTEGYEDRLYLHSWKDSATLQFIHCGAVAYIGSTGIGFAGTYDEMTVSFFRQLAENLPIGTCLLGAKLDHGDTRHQRQLILLGDPALQIAIPDPPLEFHQSPRYASESAVYIEMTGPTFNPLTSSYVISLSVRPRHISSRILKSGDTTFIDIYSPGASLLLSDGFPPIPYSTIRFNNIPRSARIKSVRLTYVDYNEISDVFGAIWLQNPITGNILPPLTAFSGIYPRAFWHYAIKNDFTTGYADILELTVNFAQFDGFERIVRIVNEYGFEIEYVNPAEIINFTVSKPAVKPYETVSFDLTVNNTGAQILTCTGEIVIYDENNILVHRLFTNTVQVSPNTYGCLSADWMVPLIPQGEYTAVAIVYYECGEAGPRTLSFSVIRDEVPPTTIMQIGSPSFTCVDITYVASTTQFKLLATDNPGGAGVASTFYRIYNSSYNTGWIGYSAPFYLTELIDGEYLIDYYSIDNIGNTEPINTETVILDNTPPATTLTIGEPKYTLDIVYVTPDTSFILEAVDAGSGVFSTAYRIFNSSYDSGWQTYVGPFNLTRLADGVYIIEFNSTDNLGNAEDTKSILIALFSWNYIFTDSYGRGTILKINLAHKFIQFITPDKNYGIRETTYMRRCGRAIIMRYYDDELRLITVAVNTKLDFCIAIAWDKPAHKQYFLIDKVGKE